MLDISGFLVGHTPADGKPCMWTVNPVHNSNADSGPPTTVVDPLPNRPEPLKSLLQVLDVQVVWHLAHGKGSGKSSGSRGVGVG